MLHADTVRTLRLYHAHGYSISDLVEWSGLTRDRVSGVINRRTHRRVRDRDSAIAVLPLLRQVEVGKARAVAKPKRRPGPHGGDPREVLKAARRGPTPGP